MPYRYFFTKEKKPTINGPFQNERDFNLALAERSQQNWELNKRHGWLSDFFARNLPLAPKGHDSVFTHSDLHQENIMVRETIDPQSSAKHYVVSAIVDWETAGWYPAYWEYAAAFALLVWSDDWPESLEAIIDPWLLEAAMLRLVHQDLEFWDMFFAVVRVAVDI